LSACFNKSQAWRLLPFIAGLIVIFKEFAFFICASRAKTSCHALSSAETAFHAFWRKTKNFEE